MAQLAGQSQKVPNQQSLPSNTTRDAQAFIEDKQAQCILQENEALFRSIANIVPVMIWVTGLDAEITFLNKVWCDYTGMPLEQALGSGWIQAFHADDRKQIIDVYFTAFQKREPFTFEARKIYNTSEYRWVLATGVPHFDNSGQFSGYVGTCLDITDRKQADTEVHLLNSILLKIEEVEKLDTALDIVLREICRATGWKCAQIWMPNQKGDKLELRLPWYGKEEEELIQFRKLNQHYTFALDEGLPGQVWRSQSPIWVEDFSQDIRFPRLHLARDADLKSALGVPVLANDNTLLGKKDVIAVMEFFRTDLQKEDQYIIRLVSSVALQLGLFIQNKMMEQAARENSDRLRLMNERFELVQKATNDSMYDWDFLTNQLHWNENTSLMFRYPKDQIRTDLEWWSEKIHPEDQHCVLEHFKECILSGKDFWSAEYRFLRGDGTYCHVMDRSYIVHDSDGQPIRMIGAMLDITDRKTAEAQLRESEERFRTMAEASPVMIWTFDEKSNVVTYANQQFLTFLGITAEQLPELSTFTIQQQFFHPDDLKDFLAIRNAAIKTGTDFKYECRLRYKNSDDYHWVLISVGPKLIHGKESQGYVGSAVDITDRKTVEEQLRESEERFRTMAEASPVMIWTFNEKRGVLTYANQRALEFIGLTLDELTHFTPSNFIKKFVHPDDCTSWLVKRSSALPLGSGYQLECRVRHHNHENDYRWILISVGSRWVGNKFQGYIGSAIDITKRKQVEHALIESESRFRNMADTAPFMIIMSDIEDGYYHFNQAWQNFTGMTQQAMYGSYWFSQQIHPKDRRFCLEKYRSAVETHKTGSFEFRMRRYDGEYRWVLASAAPRYDNDSKLIGFIGSCIEITELKQYREELERTVAERTKELEAVNRELESFSYSVSHDLRAPLRGIDGISQLVYKNYHDLLDVQGKNYLQILRQEAQRMSELINEMLNLSRLTRGTMQWGKVNLSEIAEEVAKSLKKQDPNRNVSFNIQKNVIACGDSHLLRAVLENLIGNSWKFSSKHESALIEFWAAKEPNKQTVYHVKDDGAGFEMEYAENLFGAFQRLHDSSEFPGTGIGLATVQRIIHRHGGEVWAYSEVEKGAEIFFTLGEHHA